jgi:hypothetical protein
MAFICQNTQTGHDICERTKAAYAAQGVEIIGDIQYFPVGTTDYKPFLTALKAQGDIDFLYNYDNPINTATIVRQALELDIGNSALTVPATSCEHWSAGRSRCRFRQARRPARGSSRHRRRQPTSSRVTLPTRAARTSSQ